MAFSINDIRSQLSGGGARPTLFRVQILNPFDSASNLKIPFMVTGTSLPPLSMSQIQVPYMGRTIKVPGNRSYPDWTVNVMNDADFLVRNGFETWSNRINSFEGNLRNTAGPSPLLIKSTALVEQLGVNGNILRTYRFNGIWPMEVGQIEVDWNATDQIEQFPVTFAYDWWDIEGSETGDAGGV